MKALKYITLLMFVFLFVACSEESPFEVAEEDLNEAEELAEQKYNERKSAENSVSEQEKCRRGISTYSDDYCCTYYGERCSYYSSSSYSYMSDADKCYYGTGDYSADYCCTYYGYQCAYVYSSSSSRYSSSSYYSSSSSAKTEVAEAHTIKSKTMKFTLTYYKQKTSGWDNVLGSSYTDGDPMFSFRIDFIASGGQVSTHNTGKILSLSDKGTWSGEKSVTIDVPIATQDIKICPSVVDDDLTDSGNDVMTSGNCYTKYNVGYLNDYTDVLQNDNTAKHYDLEWEWYLY